MPIKIGTSNASPYKGDYKPVNVYQGSTKLAGWKWATASGIALAQYHTDYKDTAQVSLEGNSVQPLSFREETGKSLALTNHEELSLRKLEVYGESYQVVTENSPSPDYPSPISNVADVGICSWIGGRNLIVRNNEQVGMALVGNGTTSTLATYPQPMSLSGASTMVEAIPITEGEKLTFTKTGTDYWRFNWLDKNYSFISRAVPTAEMVTLSVPTGARYLWVSYPTSAQVKIERGDTATPWTPAPEDILPDTTTNNTYLTKPTLTAPLRKVGDVADRLFYDKTVNKWKVERRVGEVILLDTSTKAFNTGEAEGSRVIIVQNDASQKLITSKKMTCSHFKQDGAVFGTTSIQALYYNYMYLYFPHSLLGTSVTTTFTEYRTMFTAWLQSQNANGTPVTIQYELETPTIETLPDGTLPPLFKLTTYLDTTSTLKGDLKAGYLLKTNTAPLETDIKVAPEYVNPIVSVNSVDIVSSVYGKNLFDYTKSSAGYISETTGAYAYYATQKKSDFIPILGASKVTISTKESDYLYLRCAFYTKKNTSSFIPNSGFMIGSKVLNDVVVNVPSGAQYLIFSSEGQNHNAFKDVFIDYQKWRVELDLTTIPSDTHTPTLYHTQPTLSQPLKKVGDVKDRLFKDTDGLWKVERNVVITGLDDGTQLISQAYSQATTPTLETLPQADQDKLNAIPTYRGDNYVYTVSDVEPSGIKVDYKVRDI